MSPFEIVAHRGAAESAPENTIAAFQRALQLGADAIELDVRLTPDRVPVVYHYFYLHENTPLPGVVFDYTFEQLRDAPVYCQKNPAVAAGRISALDEILEMFAGKIGLEIEIKGPEPESPEIVAGILKRYRHLWHMMEVTSYETALLWLIRERCPDLATDLLFPRTEGWMGPDVVQYRAVHCARLARARAVHLHPSQLSETVVSALRQQSIEVHAWDVNDEGSLETAARLGIPRVCTDGLKQALAFRERICPGKKG